MAVTACQPAGRERTLPDMTIRRKLLAYGAVGIVPTLAVAFAGYRAITGLEEKMRDNITSSVALRNHWEGDMYHEGLRADVYAALAAMTPGDKAQVRSDVAEHAERFRQALAGNRRLKLDAETVAGLNAIAPDLDAYATEAIAIVELAARDRDAALARIPKFQAAFERLEISQGKVSDLILRRQEGTANEAEAAGSFSRSFMIVMTLASLVVLSIGSWWIAMSIGRPLADGLRIISQGSRQVAAAAAQISASSQALSQAASEQAASLEETSASSEEIRATTQQSADQSLTAAARTQETVQEVEQANSALREMAVSMNEIVESASKIGNIIRVIDEIAFQTNILALNAAVEAARAGEAGMGFAVVADEVRRLAHRSAEAASSTSELIEEAISRSKTGKQKLDAVSDMMTAASTKASAIHTLSEEVNAGRAETARGIAGIAEAVAQMQQVTQQIAANAEEHAATGEQLTAQAASVDAEIANLSTMVG